MSIEFQCEQCQQLIRVPDESAGHQARCPFCQAVQPVPLGSTPPPVPSFGSGVSQSPTSDAATSRQTESSPFADQTSDNPYRQDPANPYQMRTQFPATTEWTGPGQLAPLSDRFIGVVIDYAFAIICVIPGFVLVGVGDNANNEIVQQIGAAILFVGLLAQVITQWVLISTRGQSVGKIVMKTRIVTLSGAAPGFMHGVVLRIILFGLLTTPACICYPLYVIAPVVDGLFILGERRQCLHDMVASTYVVSDKMSGWQNG